MDARTIVVVEIASRETDGAETRVLLVTFANLNRDDELSELASIFVAE